MNLIRLFKQVGGLQLLKNWIRGGVFPYALALVGLLGMSKKALEMVRNGVYLKVNQKLSKQYMYVFTKLELNKKTCKPAKNNRFVWFCWLQGIDQAPELVKKCYASVRISLKDRNVILITKNNISMYADLPDYIMNKYKKGIISHTHFSDLLRVELLSKHGGTWIDSTVFCRRIPEYMLDCDFFVFQNLKPGSDGSVLNCSSWFMTAKANNKIVMALRELLWEYWKKENKLIDYYLIHHFMEIVSKRYHDEWLKIPKYPNSLPHILLLSFFEEFSAERYDIIMNNSPVHKLSYKIAEDKASATNTNYYHFMNS